MIVQDSLKRDLLVPHTSLTRKRNAWLTRSGSKQEDRLSKFGLLKPSDSRQVRNWKTLGVWLIVLSFTLPIFRSGGRVNLTFVSWIVNHSIFGPRIEYVPKEDYSAEFM